MSRCSSLFNLLLLSLCLSCAQNASAAFEITWQGSRPWAGPQTWASPLYEWQVKDGRLVVAPGYNHLLQQTVWRVEHPDKDFQTGTRVMFRGLDQAKNKSALWAGFAVGIQGLMDDQRHILVGPKERINAGVRGDGRAFIGDQVSREQIDPSKVFIMTLIKTDAGLSLEVKLPGSDDPAIVVNQDIDHARLKGNFALAAGNTPRGGTGHGVTVAFGRWGAKGKALVRNRSNTFGPVLWSQYTRQGNDIKLLAMLAPMGEEDPKAVSLQVKEGDAWKTIDTQDYDPLTYSVLFRGKVADGRVGYRVVYNYLGEAHHWQGSFIPDPATTGEPLKIAAFSCDHGYAFPLPTMVQNVKAQKPNLLFFAGDQIYEIYGGFKLQRKPTRLAMLDYLRKYYQFGWTWRDLLATTPSIIIPDDHDVFQGNIWGAGGKPTRNEADGGYTMDPEWVNGVQRTQTAHLPDAYDPTPIKQGIGVYYTAMDWGGAPIAVIEDRKWKSGPRSVLPKKPINALRPDELDPEGAQLLGERQEAFLSEWATKTQDAPVRLILSQTIFCKGNTNSGADLKPSGAVTDTNGWPRSGRQRALTPFKDGKTVMLHGDQHLGLLVRQGIDEHNDGPYAFMVPGTANGYPRAWWPNGPDGQVAGDFKDPFGNLFSVLAAANPDVGTNQIKARNEGHPEKTAQAKGSGYGLVVIDPKTNAVTFNMFRYLFDANKPKPGDQFPGFPVTIQPQ